MDGGIDAWHGLVSRAEVDQGIYLLEGNESPEEALALAYGLEEGARRFYSTLTDRVADAGVKDLFRKLSEIEVRHQDKLWERYEEIADDTADRDAFEADLVPQALEGGSPVDQVLSRFPAQTESVSAALEFAMSLETDALDLYLRMAQASRDGGSREVFLIIAREEREHLGQLGTMLGKLVS
jgi:rubrerythrin